LSLLKLAENSHITGRGNDWYEVFPAGQFDLIRIAAQSIIDHRKLISKGKKRQGTTSVVPPFEQFDLIRMAAQSIIDQRKLISNEKKRQGTTSVVPQTEQNKRGL
jgi:metal-responsive CopG/Arc/MetJ family transcriptional regulator